MKLENKLKIGASVLAGASAIYLSEKTGFTDYLAVNYGIIIRMGLEIVSLAGPGLYALKVLRKVLEIPEEFRKKNIYF